MGDSFVSVINWVFSKKEMYPIKDTTPPRIAVVKKPRNFFIIFKFMFLSKIIFFSFYLLNLTILNSF